MTPSEYLQLKAFARIDGAFLSLLWMATFALYIIGLTSPGYGLAAIIMVVLTPFFVGSRLKRFRDDCLEGTISFLRGWAYTAYVFFYGSLLFALAQWAYFTFLDQGYLMNTISEAFDNPETAKALRQLGMTESLHESLTMIGQMRPIDLSLNMLTTNLIIGMVLGLPIAAVLRKEKPSKFMDEPSGKTEQGGWGA